MDGMVKTWKPPCTCFWSIHSTEKLLTSAEGTSAACPELSMHKEKIKHNLFFLSFLFFFLSRNARWVNLNAINIQAVMCLCFCIQLPQWHAQRCIHSQLSSKPESLCYSMTWLVFGKERFQYSVTKILEVFFLLCYKPKKVVQDCSFCSWYPSVCST